MQADREKQMHSPIRIAIISTGVQSSVVDQATNGFVMTLKNAKVLVAESSQDSVGRGTELALCLAESVPDVEIIGLDIFGGQQRTNSTLLLAALHKALELDVDVIACCVQSANTDKQRLFQDVCRSAEQKGVSLVACGSDRKRVFPGVLSGCVGVVSHIDCLEFLYYHDPDVFGSDQNVSGLFVSNGWWQGRFWGAEMATIRVASEVVQMRREGLSLYQINLGLQLRAHLPIEPFGYC